MNKDNAKHYLPLVKALADGKKIEIKSSTGWADMGGNIAFDDDPSNYRIKSEPQYASFTYETIKPHIGNIVRNKCNEDMSLIVHANHRTVMLAGIGNIEYSQLLEEIIFLDESPCGTLVEE